MPEHPEPKPEENDEANEETQSKPMGLIQYPPKPGQTQYGTYQNPNK